MDCTEVRAFLSQVSGRADDITPISSGDLNYLCSNGYAVSTTKDDYDKAVAEVARLSQLTAQEDAEKLAAARAADALKQDESKAGSFLAHFQAEAEKEALRQKIQGEMAAAGSLASQLSALDENVNALIQEKSMTDRMVPYGGGYVSLTDLGNVILNDLVVRDYRTADEQFPDFVTEARATYAELRSIAERASSYVGELKAAPLVAKEVEDLDIEDQSEHEVMLLLWETGIGLGKLQGDVSQIGYRASQALDLLKGSKSQMPSKLMAAEVMTALNRDINDLASDFNQLDGEVRAHGVQKETSAGIAATLLAGRRYDGTYPVDNFLQFQHVTSSDSAASVLAVMNVPFEDLNARFQSFKQLFSSWGYTGSKDTELASAFLAIGELGAGEVGDKLQYIVEQLKNYLEYPLIPAAILASIPVFEAHEALDLMEKAVTLLTGYVSGFERSETVAMAVGMIHGVRNEIVSGIDPKAALANTPVQFTYGAYPGLLRWYYPVIITGHSYVGAFSGMGAFHPAHFHGIGGFAG